MIFAIIRYAIYTGTTRPTNLFCHFFAVVGVRADGPAALAITNNQQVLAIILETHFGIFNLLCALKTPTPVYLIRIKMGMNKDTL